MSITSGNHLQPSKIGKIKIKLSKCQFFEHLHYLEHIISKQGIQPLPEKVIAITNLKEPNCMDDFSIFSV